MPKEFHFRGFSLEQLKAMPMDDFIGLLPSRVRRSLRRGLTPEQRKLLERMRALRAGDTEIIKTHVRDIIILPEMVGKSLLVYNGKEFGEIKITERMIGHYLGEFSSTNRPVRHGKPGIGASRSSMYIPLK